MSDDDRLRGIERKLDEHGETLKGIQMALEKVAVQHEQITQLQKETTLLWSRIDEVCGPNGALTRATHFQASCPRAQIRWLWCIVIPQGLTMFALGMAILRVAGG